MAVTVVVVPVRHGSAAPSGVFLLIRYDSTLRSRAERIPGVIVQFDLHSAPRMVGIAARQGVCLLALGSDTSHIPLRTYIFLCIGTTFNGLVDTQGDSLNSFTKGTENQFATEE